MDRLEKHWDAAVALTSEGRARVWRLYMAAAALSFETGKLGVNQVAGPEGRAAHRRRCAGPTGSESARSGKSLSVGAVTVQEFRACVLRADDPSTDKEALLVSDGPLIVQSDKTLLLEVDHPLAKDCRAAIAPFAELERSPEHVHTYRVTPLALWNARAAGHDAEQVVDALVRYSRYPVPHALLVDVADTMDRFGRLTLANNPVHGLVLTTSDRAVLEEVIRSKRVAPMLGARIDAGLGRRARLRARPAQAGAAEDRLAGRGPRRLRRRRRRTRSSSTSRTGTCATTSRRPSRASGPAARASSSCPVARARRWSAPRRWPRRRRPR